METGPEIGTSPRVVFGVTLYNHAQHLRESIDSLVSQKYPDFAIVLVDDQSTDDTPQIAVEYADAFPNVSYHRNDRRLGLARNWREAFLLARARYPAMEYFAWASDHDVWHPRWLPAMVRALEENPRALLAYPFSIRLTDERNDFRKHSRSFDTHGMSSRANRLLRAVWTMKAGNMVYGLFRADALEQGGIFRTALLPDRLLLAELSLIGEFVQVPQILWYRRYRFEVSVARQRQSIFPEGAPFHSYLPWWMVHGAVMVWQWAVLGVGRSAGVGRLRGALLALALLLSYTVHETLVRPWRRLWRNHLRKRVLPQERRFGKATRRSRLREARSSH